MRKMHARRAASRRARRGRRPRRAAERHGGDRDERVLQAERSSRPSARAPVSARPATAANMPAERVGEDAHGGDVDRRRRTRSASSPPTENMRLHERRAPQREPDDERHRHREQGARDRADLRAEVARVQFAGACSGIGGSPARGPLSTNRRAQVDMIAGSRTTAMSDAVDRADHGAQRRSRIGTASTAPPRPCGDQAPRRGSRSSGSSSGPTERSSRRRSTTDGVVAIATIANGASDRERRRRSGGAGTKLGCDDEVRRRTGRPRGSRRTMKRPRPQQREHPVRHGDHAPGRRSSPRAPRATARARVELGEDRPSRKTSTRSISSTCSSTSVESMTTATPSAARPVSSA